MSQPLPPAPEQPEPVAEVDPTAAPDPAPDDETTPLNRAARRAKAKKAEPTHVGPRADLAGRVRGGRPHPKRRR